MFSKYTVRKVFKDESTINIGDNILISTARSIVAIVDFPNDDDASEIVTRSLSGTNLSDQIIGDQARGIIASLNAQEAALASVTVGVETSPPAPTQPDPKQLAINAARVAYEKELRLLQAKQDPTLLAKYEALQALIDPAVVDPAGAVGG